MTPGFCSENQLPNQNCTFVVQQNLSCGVNNYTIYNQNGTAVENNNLTSVLPNSYGFTFNQPLGDYVVHLCDGTNFIISTQEEGGGSMISFMFVLLPFLVAGILLWFNHQIDAGEHMFVRFIFGIFSLLCTMFGAWAAIVINIDFVGSGNLETMLVTFLYSIVIVMVAFFSYMALYMIFKPLSGAAQNKNRDLRY